MLGATVVAAGCSGPAGDARAQDVSNVTAEPRPEPRTVLEEQQARQMSFDQWLAGFRARALSEGITPGTFDAVMAGIGPSARIRELDGSQPEFVRPVWEYLDTAVSDTRVANGRREAERLDATMDEIEARYGTDQRTVLAIWGMETAYGSVRGDFPVARALATLAHEGRRRDWAENELIAAMRIVDQGDARPGELIGSWAGAMGHTQFMPSSFQAYAQDFDGNGRRDIWSDDPTDALASTAHYLRQEGWQPGEPWGFEVRLPEGFDWDGADRYTRRSMGEWRARGVTRYSGAALPDTGEAALLAPAGAGGPVFLTFSNFNTIKRYNNSDSYALAIGLLGDRITGGPGVQADWPRDVLPLTRSDRRELQQRLTALGYDTDGVDGLIGPNSVTAIRNFQRDVGLVPDGYASNQLLAAVRERG
ncbi:lytic murein transglycosylase [Roseobacter sp. HKCCA0434]|uniref:lytic murein transglycosylase n=1 Tax=Roseobacter sp. HKCCA0434 TaxID=3079297 RepID=UPI00290597CA|nr:lytic murein transglycosylase [Roseobacter sp. HKCCA0434]